MFQEIQMSNRPKSQYMLVIAAAFLSLMAIVGFAYYGIPFYFDFIVEKFGWSRAVVTSGNAVAKLIIGPVFGFIAGSIIDKYGPRRMMLVGALFGGISLIGLGFTSSLPMFYFFYFFNALGYVFGGPLPVQVLISQWFNKNRGKVMGIAYLGIGIGGAMVHQISTVLERNLGWSIALSTLGVIIILIAFPLPLFLKKAPSVTGEVKEPVKSAPIKEVLKNRNFYLVALGSICSIGAVGGVVQHLKLYLTDMDFSQSDAAFVMSLVLLSSLIGRVVMGYLADIFPRKYVMMLIFGIVAFAISLLLMPDFPYRIYIFAVIFGIGIGGDYMIIPLIAGDLFGVRVLGRVMGIVLVADGASEATIPMLVGALYNEATSSYFNGFILTACLAMTGLIIISMLPKHGIHRWKD